MDREATGLSSKGVKNLAPQLLVDLLSPLDESVLPVQPLGVLLLGGLPFWWFRVERISSCGQYSAFYCSHWNLQTYESEHFNLCEQLCMVQVHIWATVCSPEPVSVGLVFCLRTRLSAQELLPLCLCSSILGNLNFWELVTQFSPHEQFR